MPNHVYKSIDLTGTSGTSVEDAVNRALATAHRTLRNLSWFQVVETRGSIRDGRVGEWQVTIKVAFAIEE